MIDVARWGQPSSYSARWIQRAIIISEYLKDCEHVLDLGAGTQILKPLIKSRYTPVDAVSLGPDTILIDFDSNWSASMLPQCDGIAIAGLLEHLADPLDFISRLAPVGDVWAVSYMDSRHHTSHKLITLKRLEKAFNEAGLRVDQRKDWRRQAVYRLVRI